MNYIVSSSSINMVEMLSNPSISMKSIQIKDIPMGCISKINDSCIASAMSRLLGYDLPVSDTDIVFREQDTLYIAEYLGTLEKGNVSALADINDFCFYVLNIK